MANENASRDNPSRQQSSERAQSGSTTSQQGAGVGQGQGSPGRPGLSTWQGGRSGQSGSALQRRGALSMSPYGSNYESGYGGGPFSIMRRISDEMDRFFENFGMGRGLLSHQDEDEWGQGQRGGQNAPSMWSPHIDVSERKGKLVIQADLPGIKRDDINVRVEQDHIIIQGQRHQEQTTSQSGYYRSERSYGSFYRAIPLPEGTDADSASASFRDGVLEIELDAPRQQQRGRTLEIRDGGSGSSYGGSGTGSLQGQGGQVERGQGGQAGTGSGSAYGSGTSGSMQGSTSGGTGVGSATPSGTSDRSSDRSHGSGS